MYKPFVTCDDPKGVIECGTIMRYRTNSNKMKDKTKGRRTAENLETNKQDKEDKASSNGSTERDFDPSSLQLVEVSRGAEKLNTMIESWSRGLRYDGKSEDIAKDLLKGALDLQESLEMLRKVQEVSHKMARSKSKQDEKPERSRMDVKVNDRIRTTHSNQFVEQNHSIGVQRGSALADGSSSSCREELKKVIKESLVRQNLFQTTSTSEGLDSASAAFPSTSSSQSSVVWYDKLSDSSMSPNFSRKGKNTNLVAKLMGLEQFPSRTFPSVMQKQLENQKVLNQKRPVFEIDTPKVRKNSAIIETFNPEKQKTIREILETPHFNELLRNSPIRENKLHVHHDHYNDLHYKHFDELPPIVLMKPRYASYQEFGKTYEPVPREELSFRNLKAKADPSKTFKPREVSTINTRKEMEEHLSKRLTKEERPKRVKEVVEFDVKEIKPREVSTINMRKEMEEHLSKRLTKEERPKRVKEVVEFDVKEIKPVENKKALGGKVKENSHASQKLQASEAVDEKVKVKENSHASHKLQASEKVDEKAKIKTVTIRRKPLEKEVSKPKVVTKAQDQGEISSTSEKLSKPRSVSRIDKSEIPCRKNTASNSNTIPKPKTQKFNNSKELRKSQTKKQKPVVDESEAVKPLDEQLKQEEGKSINVSCEDESAEIKIITTITDDLIMELEREIDTYANKTIYNCEEGQNSSYDDVLMLNCEHENDAILDEKAHDTAIISETDCKHNNDNPDTTSINETDFKPDKESSELKYLLLTSKSFIDHADELLDLDIDYPKILPKIETNEMANTKLYLDCANELTARKSLKESSPVVPLLLTCVTNSRLSVSLGSLVDEVYNAIENLTSYSENSETKLILDNVCAMLERDMKCNNRLMNGIWNCGWKHGFSCDEVEQVVNEVENMVLDGLIEEIIVNF